MAEQERVYSVWVIARLAADLPGQWVAHCLDFDVVSQGDTLQHAMMMVAEAAGMVVMEDLNAGRDPLSRRAPEAEFDAMWNVVQHGQRVPQEVAFADRTGECVYAFGMELRCVCQPQRAPVPSSGAPNSAPRPSLASTTRGVRVAFAQHKAS